MRQFIIAAAMALGLIALWAAILPLTAQPAPAPTAVTTPAFSKALFLCRGPNGIDRTCAAALARALVLDTSDNTVTHVSDRLCHVGPEMRASLDRRD
ncbi:MAG TPA: hypothetical protein VKI44_32170 [Acetobacteraceae bacterium]|nr:hypothetical protein [Acetobacteraceae bacterium]